MQFKNKSSDLSIGSRYPLYATFNPLTPEFCFLLILRYNLYKI